MSIWKRFLMEASTAADVLILDMPANGQSIVLRVPPSPNNHALVVVRPGITRFNSLRILAEQLKFQHFDSGSIVLSDVTESEFIAAIALEQEPVFCQ